MPEVDWDSFGTAPVAADLPKRKNPCRTRVFESVVAFNGESGIRTHGEVTPTHDFQSCSLSHSDISPRVRRSEDY